MGIVLGEPGMAGLAVIVIEPGGMGWLMFNPWMDGVTVIVLLGLVPLVWLNRIQAPVALADQLYGTFPLIFWG